MISALLSLFAVSSVVLLARPVRGNVLGIDFGAENMKVGIVSPGSPLDIGKQQQ